jgi:predicted deacetylase
MISMAVPTTAAAGHTAPPPAALVSLHDVSPLTLADCQTALTLLRRVGLQVSQLTILVVPRHDDEVSIDEHPPTQRWLRALADDGARLVMHGFTHRMPGRAWSPAGILAGHLFARGQGELFQTNSAETRRRLEQAAEILRRAGLEEATRAFIPPAWLMSRAAHSVIAGAGFDFYERFGGVMHARARYARRLIGWGSLSRVEASATALYASLKSRVGSTDTRIAVHPADMRWPGQQRAIEAALRRTLGRMRAESYTTFLARVAATAM